MFFDLMAQQQGVTTKDLTTECIQDLLFLPNLSKKDLPEFLL